MGKKCIAILLCMVLVLSLCACAGNETSSKDTADQENLDFKVVWKDQSDFENIQVDYKKTGYQNNVPNYTVQSDLSNIENIERFQDFSVNQKQMLSKNGFVVLGPNPQTPYLYMKMYDIYEDNEYKHIPNFITVDVAIHLYHKFFSETLKSIEKQYLYEELSGLTNSMLEKTISLYENQKDSKIKNDLEGILIYFSVANKLLNNTYGNIPDVLQKTAEEEIDLITTASGYMESPLTGFDVNYEQFIVRGHYTEDESLEKYFKGMMWYGLLGFPLVDEENDSLYVDHTVKALLMTYIAFIEADGKDDIEAWDKIYSPTDFLVGKADDITIFQLKDIIIKVFGENPDIDDFREETYYEDLLKEVKQLPDPQIQQKLVLGVVDTPTQKQFRFMGQRYTLDANIIQELMFPIIRPVPSGLDVTAAFSSKRGEELVYQYYVPEQATEKYGKSLDLMKEKVKALKEDDWKSNLYNGWLWSIKSILKNNNDTSGMPLFMKSKAWEDKNINTALGSYAELKHDTVLYAKQPAAEMGGPGEEPEYTPNYVEPNVEVYEKLIWLLQYSKANLETRGLLDADKNEAIERLHSLYTLFRDCSVKELANEPLSQEENDRLKYIGGAMEFVDDTFSSQYRQMISSALVSDIAGIADVGAFLEIGTEVANEIYVAIYDNGKVYLARGAVFGYHEFLSSEPLTDEKWHEMLGIERVEQEGWVYEQINSDRLLKDTPPQPQWVYSFKSDEVNNVQVDYVEYIPE